MVAAREGKLLVRMSFERLVNSEVDVVGWLYPLGAAAAKARTTLDHRDQRRDLPATKLRDQARTGTGFNCLGCLGDAFAD